MKPFWLDHRILEILPQVGHDSRFFAIGEGVIVYSLPFVAIGVAILMISRIRYPHPINLYFKGRKPLTHLLWSVAVGGMVYLFHLESALLITFCGFALSGFLRWFYNKVILSKTAEHQSSEPAVLNITNPQNEDSI